jgi:hypothetical protein
MSLSPFRAARLQLLARIAQDLAMGDETDEPESSLLELEGLGAEIWQGVGTQQYMNELRVLVLDDLEL